MIARLFNAIHSYFFRDEFLGFIEGHGYLTESDQVIIQDLVKSQDNELVEQFERKFAAEIGRGECVSFTAGRMAFYSLLLQEKIGHGDEVILTGYTCSVMADAIIRTGATIRYADIDKETFGTSADSVKQLVGRKTRMIVAQHSFGIPCDIERIVQLAQDNDIFLLEDCAISFGSLSNGKKLGNFGNAAIFSTDHSKPINTFTGGLLYSTDDNLITAIKSFRDDIPELPQGKRQAIWNRILEEKEYCCKQNYKKLPLYDFLKSITRRLSPGRRVISPYLDEDQDLEGSSTYPYPARFPSFLAYLGLLELANWADKSRSRRDSLQKFLKISKKHGFSAHLPAAYFDNSLSIVPLRIVWSQGWGTDIRQKISKLVDISQTWFLDPIISTRTPLEDFGYKRGACPVSEKLCINMVNLPVTIKGSSAEKIVSLIVE